VFYVKKARPRGHTGHNREFASKKEALKFMKAEEKKGHCPVLYGSLPTRPPYEGSELP